MVKRIFIIIVISAIFFSCNNAENKKIPENNNTTANRVTNKNNEELYYFDTANDMRNILCQYWVLQDDAEGLNGMEESSTIEIPYRSLYLATDGSFIKSPRSTFDYGNWTYDNATKKIILNNTIDKTKDIYSIASLATDELVLVNTGVGSSNNLKFISGGFRFKNENNEPFYSANNRWRMKPLKKESDTNVHERLKENLHFFIVYHKAAIATNEQVVSFWGFPSCFKIYGGGIFLKNKNDLKANWINCFFNKEQAMLAYAIADKLLDQKYTWPKDEHNWIKQNLYVLEQMYKKIDEIK